jgi:glycosyltransferase involved in cell wall biosynthesis
MNAVSSRTPTFGIAPPISVGVPVYNGEKYLRVALDALLKQTFADFEIIICDNASTDATQAIAQEYAARDPRIRYVRSAKNIGANGNFHYVFTLARGQYFQWNSVDDYFAPVYLEKCKAVLDSDAGAVLCCAKVSVIDEAGAIIEQSKDAQELPQTSAAERFKQKFAQDSRNNTLYGLIRSEVLRKTKVVENYTGSDNVLMEHLALYGRFREVPDYLFFRRTHPDAFTYAPTIERIRQFYAPEAASGGGKFGLVASRHIFEYARIISSTPIPLADRAALVSFLLRTAWWKKGVMLKEIVALITFSFRKGGRIA